MKIRFICASALSALLLSLGSCSSDNTFDRAPEDAAEHTLTFNLRLPAGEKVSYARAIHDAEEYAINTLTLYEYEVVEGEDGAKTTSLTRVMEYPNGTGKNTIDLKQDENGSCKFSIIVPAANDGKTFTYKFVANRDVENKTLGTSFEKTLNVVTKRFTVTPPNLDGGAHPANGGILMTGTAIKDGNEELVMSKGLSCDVGLVRTIARVDVRHEIPNLKIKKVTYKGLLNRQFIFPQSELPIPTEGDDVFDMALNKAVELPDHYLNDEGVNDTKVELKKAFYVYERQNMEANCAYVAIEYKVKANGKEYDGYIEVPFKSTTTDEYVDILRNHLYTIVLGNGNDPISGKVTAKLVVDDWNPVDVDEPLTDDDQEVTND